MLVYRKVATEKNNHYKPTGSDNIDDILKNLEDSFNILQNMYERTKKLNSFSGQKLDKVVSLVHKIHSAANDALTEFDYRLR